MKYHYQIHSPQICEILMQAALGVSAVCGDKHVTSDMVYSLNALAQKIRELKEPYYVAIRAQGTESGNKSECVNMCKALGYPLIIAKIEEDETFNSSKYNITIAFTSGWKDKDINYMEQEFNSL